MYALRVSYQKKAFVARDWVNNRNRAAPRSNEWFADVQGISCIVQSTNISLDRLEASCR